jgi:hypothetical protein
MKIQLLFIGLFISISLPSFSQEEVSPYDFGRMWTFEQPPTEWFKEAYDMEVDQAWFDDVRMSSLRFASWCSASFVSPDGLIMTNHHCSRDVAISVQQGKENFDKNGYYAKQLEDERRVDDLFVEQLIKIEDITARVLKAKSMAADDNDALVKAQEMLKTIQAEYEQKAEWAGLRLQTVSFYSGGKYSLYGYKKYDDIRLVLIPENDLGFYGGDPDNFTFPRYNLDCTFWRAYDENGNPLNTSENYYKFNIDGIEEGTPVFVIGNPGRTERYRTVAQLEFDRDYRFKHLLTWLTNRRDMMLVDYNVMKDKAGMVRQAQELLSTINNLSNSIKAYTGIMGGLHNSKFMGRKEAMEEKIKASSGDLDYWDELSNEYEKLNPHAWAINLLGPSALRGNAFLLMHEVAKYKALVENKAEAAEITAAKESILGLTEALDKDKEKQLLTVLLNEVKSNITRILNGMTVDGFVNNLFQNSTFLKDRRGVEKLLSKDKKITKLKDPMIKASETMVNRYQEANEAFSASSAYRRSLETKIANQAFNVFGTSLPPDATFTLRISDGLVKSYDYNGTTAPIMTTYYGMYDRHYSNGGIFPWALPDKWMNPPSELLRSPLNFVSTNDIIGGNSGSAIINQEGEAVGLIFDGNIESLPGNFIFDEESNRSVSVHAGGIYAAMKYIYKADRIINELLPQN